MVGYDGARNVRDKERRVVTETDPPPTSELEERSKEHSSSIPTRAAVLAAAVLLGIIVYGYLDMPGSGWIGVANKKFWNYLDLLIVPAALALGVYWLNRRQNERDQQAEETQRERELEVENRRGQDAALQTYLDQMSQLLTDKERPLHKAQPGDTLSTVARARTLTVLARLDSERKGSVVRFLYEAGLINKDHLIVDLQRSRDLRGADLSATYLTNSSLCRVDLSGVDLRRTFMPGANLSGADLSGVNLSDAQMNSVNLKWANLDGAILSGANLPSADLSSARGVTQEQLAQAWSLQSATMTNGQRYEEWIKEDEEGRSLYMSPGQKAIMIELLLGFPEDEEGGGEGGEGISNSEKAIVIRSLLASHGEGISNSQRAFLERVW
jgi:uncharacterized protein YjbI with pentapeptide repeats